MKTIHRYLLRNWLWDFTLAFSIISLLFLIGNLVQVDSNIGLILPIIPTLLPGLLGYTLPMASLTATISTLAKLRSEGEMTTLASGGVSFTQILRPFVLAGLVLAILTLVSFEWIQPPAERYRRSYLGNLGAKVLKMELAKKQCEIPMGDSTLFFFQNDVGARSALIQERSGGRIVKEMLADSVEYSIDEKARTISLNMRNMNAMYYAADGTFESFFCPQFGPFVRDYKETRPYSESPRFMPLSTLWRRMDGPGGKKELLEMKACFHEKLGLMLSPLVLGMAAFPLAFLGQRSSRLQGFVLAMALIFVLYYPLLNATKKLAMNGLEPQWLLLQLPNLAVLAIALIGLMVPDRRV